MFLQLQAVAPKRLQVHFQPEVQVKQQIQLKPIHLDCADSSCSSVECVVEKPARHVLRKLSMVKLPTIRSGSHYSYSTIFFIFILTPKEMSMFSAIWQSTNNYWCSIFLP
jgi:hypothetical protein